MCLTCLWRETPLVPQTSSRRPPAPKQLPPPSEGGIDRLTGLADRHALLESASRALAGGRGHVAVLCLDIERLRGVNEAMGMQAGDRVLAAFAERLTGVVRHADVAARIGGDEFALCCSGLMQRSEGPELATRVVVEVERVYQIDGRDLPLRVSVGMAIGAPGECTADDLLRDAGAAMYAAKAQGGGIVAFSEQHRQSGADRFELETALHGAVERQDFSLHYQPIVTLPALRVTGVEALIRWNTAERGWIPPAEFIPVAEQNGLILPIGHWVMHTAADQLERWSAAGHDLGMSLNLSARQLADPALPFEVSQLAGRRSVNPGRLTLEVTETTVMENLEVAVSVMRILHELGVRLAIDDFGTGYASLTQLRHIPADELKLDRSFSSDLADDRRERALVRAAIEMAHALEMEVVAEGVETAAQLEILRELGCDTVQGYYLARPAPPESVQLTLAAA